MSFVNATGTQLTTTGSTYLATLGGNVGIGTTSPGSLFSISGITNFTTSTSTFYGTGGINLIGGCFAVNGTCVGGAGTVTSVGVGSTGSTLTLSGTNPVTTSGTINAELNLGHSNIWTALQSFNTASSSVFSALEGLYVGRLSTTTIRGDGYQSSFLGSLNIATTSTSAFNIQDGFLSNILTVNTASTTGPLFAIFATTSTATSCGTSGITCLFSVDQYGHQSASSTAPTLSSCGTSPSLSSDSNDVYGTITVGSTATGCTLTFGTAHNVGTHCNITNQSASVVNAMTYTESLAGFVVSQTGLASNLLDYSCKGQ